VEEFNRRYGRNYIRQSCLDVEDRNTKQPEVLLVSPGNPDMVVERKSVCWPREFFKDHSNFHQLGEMVSRALGARFPDGRYVVVVSEEALRAKSKTEIRRIAHAISEAVISSGDAVHGADGLRAMDPIPWAFRPACPGVDYDESSPPDMGVGLVSESANFSGLETFREDVAHALSGFRAELAIQIEKATEKLRRYPTAQRVLLVQFFSDSEVVFDEDLTLLVKEAPLPPEIDQIWVAYHSWINENDYEVAWKQIRP